MAKDEQIAFRVDAKTKEALLEAAEEDGRTMSSLAAKIIIDWLKKRKPK